MVAIYGATADVHDRVTRNPGSFEAAMRGFAYLKEAGVGFTVQIIPMQENYHQLQAMEDLAKIPQLQLSDRRSLVLSVGLRRRPQKPGDPGAAASSKSSGRAG